LKLIKRRDQALISTILKFSALNAFISQNWRHCNSWRAEADHGERNMAGCLHISICFIFY